MENVLQELLAAIFWAPIHFKRYQNASGCGTVCKKDVLRIFAKFTGKTLCQSLFFNKVAGCNKVTLAPFLQNTSGRLLLLILILKRSCTPEKQIILFFN